MKTKQLEAFNQVNTEINYATPTTGWVVDVADPQQRHRVRVIVPKWNEQFSTKVEDLPWAQCCSPLFGIQHGAQRGPNGEYTYGGVGFGLLLPPQVGMLVEVYCLDGDPECRMYRGAIVTSDAMVSHGNGKFVTEQSSELPDFKSSYGPLSTTENLIQPLASNLQRAFNYDPSKINYEWVTRAADYSPSAVTPDNFNNSITDIPNDDSDGYATTRSSKTPTVMGFVTPGFHAFTADDRPENCRIRLRSTCGKQILLDDTNERIYISTASGSVWIELDEAGNLDIHADRRVSIHSTKDINLTSDGNVNIKGTNVNIVAMQDSNVLAKNVNFKALKQYVIEAGGNISISTIGNFIQNFSNTLVNTVPGLTAVKAFLPSRIPNREPWARTCTKNDQTVEPEHDYESGQVNRIERGEVLNRNRWWKR